MEWFRTVVLFITLVGFIQWISPAGVFEPYIKYIISLLTLAIIISPLADSGHFPKADSVIHLPFDMTFNDPGYDDTTARLQEIQRLQTESLTQEKESGITGEDPDVYIEQESVNSSSKSAETPEISKGKGISDE
ncbi:MAG: stage III sporulation protein AF [Firmicutes bacterium]|nr:stage III sporulation protein AF [Bacillota bacterium]